jgi:hypothetical protein
MDLEFQKHRDVVAKCVISYIFVMLKMLKTCSKSSAVGLELCLILDRFLHV